MPKNNLRGKIIAVFGSVKKFANAVSWSTRKAYDLLNGRQEMTAKDMDIMCQALHVEMPEEFRELFFT